MPERRTASATAFAPSPNASTSASEPRNAVPIAVRAPATITASRPITAPLLVSEYSLSHVRIVTSGHGDGKGERAEGRPWVITPGGREGRDTPGVREFAHALAGHGNRVLIRDRPNTGESDVCFEGESESAMQADVLAELLRRLGLAPW